MFAPACSVQFAVENNFDVIKMHGTTIKIIDAHLLLKRILMLSKCTVQQ